MGIFVGRHPADRRFVHADVLGDIPEDQRLQVAGAVLEKFLLELEDAFHDLVDRPLPLLQGLDEPLGAPLLVPQVAEGFRVQPLFFPQQSEIVVGKLQLGQAVVVELDDILPVHLEDIDVGDDIIGLFVGEFIAGKRDEAAYGLDLLHHRFDRGSRLAGNEGVVSCFKQVQVIADDPVGQGIFQALAAQLQAQGFTDIPGGDPRRVKLLHALEYVQSGFLAAARVGADVGYVGLEEPVAVQVADDEHGNVQFPVVEIQVRELPLHVGLQSGLAGDEVELGGRVGRGRLPGKGQVAVKGVDIVGPVDFSQSGRILPGDLGGHRRLAPLLRLLVGEGVGLGRLVRLFRGLFEQGILFQFGLQRVGQFKPVQLQKLDGLAQLRRHDQFLGQLKLLSEF